MLWCASKHLQLPRSELRAGAALQITSRRASHSRGCSQDRNKRWKLLPPAQPPWLIWCFRLSSPWGLHLFQLLLQTDVHFMSHSWALPGVPIPLLHMNASGFFQPPAHCQCPSTGLSAKMISDGWSVLPSGSILFFMGCLCVCVCVLVTQSCPAPYDPMDYSPPNSSVHGILQARNTRVSSHFLLQGIFLTQGLNLDLLHCRQILYHLSHQRSSMGCLQDTQPKEGKHVTAWKCGGGIWRFWRGHPMGLEHLCEMFVKCCSERKLPGKSSCVCRKLIYGNQGHVERL